MHRNRTWQIDPEELRTQRNRILPIEGGDGSTLSLDFTTGVLDPRLTFTRLGNATFIGADGLVKTATTNTARFDYDPTSIGTPRGLLIESSATNICTYSGDMTQSGAGHWTTRTNLDTSAWTGFTAPDGTSTAVKLIPNTTNGLHNIQSVSGSLTLVAYTASAFVKADGRTVVGLAIGGSQAWQNFVLTGNGSLGSASTSPAPNSTITPIGSTGWYRVTMTWTSTLSASGVQLFVTLPQTSSTSPFSSYAGDGTQNGVQAWGYQLELGSGASSYIPSGASQGSRGADNCVTAIANLTGFNANQGTIYEAWRDNTASDTTVLQEWAFAFGLTGANGVGIFVANSASGTFGLSGGISNTGDAGPAGTYVIGGLNKAAIAINVAGTSLKLSANGSAVATGTNIGGYNTAQTFSLGQRNNNTRYLNGWIRQFKYWPYLLPDAQLQSLTT